MIGKKYQNIDNWITGIFLFVVFVIFLCTRGFANVIEHFDMHLHLPYELMREMPEHHEEAHYQELQEKINNGTATDKEKEETAQFVRDWLVKNEDATKLNDSALAVERDRASSNNDGGGTYTCDLMDREQPGRDS